MVKAGAIGIAGALVAVAIAFLVGDAISGPFMVTPPGADAPEELPIGAALFSTVLGGLIGLALAALCKRFLSNPAAAFLGICVVGLIVYGIIPFTASEAASTGVWLNVMHLAAAVPIVGSLVQELRVSNLD